MEMALGEQLAPCRGLSGVVDVRARGAIGVVQVERLHHREKLCDRLVQAGVWLRPFHDMIYLTPPLSITAEQLRKLTSVTCEVIDDWSHW